MRLPFAPLAAIALAATFSAAPDPLRVLRAGPGDVAAPGDTITVSFDRPVAGALDDAVDAGTIVTVTPNIVGRYEWRDPVTLRIIPAAPLPRGQRYAVRVSDDFRAMDGSALSSAYAFSFRVRGPTLIGGDPVFGRDTGRHIAHAPTFTLVYDAPVDAATVAREARVQPTGSCRDANGRTVGTVTMRAAPGSGARRDSVELQPTQPLPANCLAALVVPRELALGTGDNASTALPAARRWPFRTHGAFRMDSVRCLGTTWCPHGPLVLRFSTPVRGQDLAQALSVAPGVPVQLDTTDVSDSWRITGAFAPRTAYALIMQRGLRDVFGQSLTGNPSVGVRTTGYAPDVQAPFGRLMVERTGFRTLAVRTMNIDTLLVERLAIPDTAVARLLAGGEWTWREFWLAQERRLVRTPTALTRTPDRARIVAVPMPAGTAAQPQPALQLVRVRDARDANRKRDDDEPEWFRLALVQVTDLGVHAKIGDNEGTVWVTDARNGRVHANARVVLHDNVGAVLATATTNADGLAALRNFTWRRPDTMASNANNDERPEPLDEGYVTVTLGDDRAVLPIRYADPDLAPWRFGLSSAYGAERATVAATVFTERDLYRPGETVYAKAIVRTGLLGTLDAPHPSDTVRWIRRDREYRTIDSVVTTLSEFGTADLSLTIPVDAGIGSYRVALEWRHRREWQEIADVAYRIAEYRPPAFLVQLDNTREPTTPRDTLGVHVSARYLFGGVMAGAGVQWSLTKQRISADELGIPGIDGWLVGDSDDGWLPNPSYNGPQFVTSATDSLGTDGALNVRIPVPDIEPGHPVRLSFSANVSDVNRQVVGSRTSAVVHPAAFYLAGQPQGDDWFWRSDVSRSVAVKAVRPDGSMVNDVRVDGVLVRREWHRVQRVRGGTTEMVGEWVADTVSRCTLTTRGETATCAVTPEKGGAHSLILRSRDRDGQEVVTAFTRWVTGPEWVPWSDDNQLKLDVIADKARYAPGDTATIMFASPFTDAEAWITVEREGVISQHRQRLTSGTTTFKLPITEAHAPNVFVSMLVARGRSEQPGTLGDPGRPTIRVGFAELRVTPEVKRLSVLVAPDRPEYRPGDTARVRVAVRDNAGRGVRSEVTLWAVDQGVLSLTGFRTPDPLDRIYQPRGIGLTLASTLANVAPQLPEGEKSTREPGGGGGGADDGVLRSRFRTTAFFLGSVVTDAAGVATASAALPDNLTTFRVMAVAVNAHDRYGSGDSTVLVTRPLVARAALPRFVRPGDQVNAGATVNRREGATGDVRVDAKIEGARLTGSARQNVRVEAGRGVDVRFPFTVPAGESVTFRFDAQSRGDRDALQVTVPVRPDGRPIVSTQSVMAVGSTPLTLPFLDDADAARSSLTIALGGSPLALVRAAAERARVYPWACTEQMASTIMPLIALTAANQAPDNARAEIARVVRVLQQRQRNDGGIGYWSSTDWTTPWLSAHAALVLVEARAIGIPVDSMVLQRVSGYLTRAVGEPESEYAPTRGRTPVSRSYSTPSVVLSEYVAAVDALRALGDPNVSAENDLVRQANRLSAADRARLARLLAERGDRTTARTLLEGLWTQVVRDGRRAFLPDTLARDGFYFATPLRATGALLRATLAVDPAHPLLAPMIESVVAEAGGGDGWFGVTPDMATATRALLTVHQRQQAAVQRGVRVMIGTRTVFAIAPGSVSRDTTITLQQLLRGSNAQRGDSLVLQIVPTGTGAPLFASATLSTVSRTPPSRPLDQGITVERWTEDPESGRPVLQAVAGALVRVRLRITVPFARSFVSVEDPLPAGLEPVDLSMRTAVLTANAPSAGDTPVGTRSEYFYGEEDDPMTAWSSGRWDAGYWTPFEHRELRDDRITWSATTVFPGRFTLSYLARATTAGTFVRPPAFAEEMYDPSVFGRTEGGVFTVTVPR